MNGTGFGSSLPESYRQQHRMRSMSWCESGEVLSTSISKHKCEDALLKQNNAMASSINMLRSDSAEPSSCSSEIINLKKPSARKNAWGCLSYADLIAKAIESSPNQRLTLNQIYSWMVENVPYFRAKGQTNSSAGWKNSIRHNLSLHGRFVRVQNEGAGKSSWWMVNNNNRMQKTPRRRSTTMDSKSFEKKKKMTTFPKDCLSIESPSLSASVPAYIGTCGPYQQSQVYPQFSLNQQQPQTQPLDSFETAFRPVDRQCCDQIFKNNNDSSAKSSTILGYGSSYKANDSRIENIFENEAVNSRNNSNGPNSQVLFCSLPCTSPQIKQSDACQQFNENEFSVAAPLPSQLSDRGLPDFFKLPDDAWRQYLPPSPNGLTEAVISSESLTALLETGADSEIVDLVPPSLSTFDEGQDRKKTTAEEKEPRMLAGAPNELISDLPGDPLQEAPHGLKQLNSILNNSPVSTSSSQGNRSTSILSHILVRENYEVNESQKYFDRNASQLSTDSYSSIQGKNYPMQGHQVLLCSRRTELEGAFEDGNCSSTLPYNLPSSADNSATLAPTRAVPSDEIKEELSQPSQIRGDK